MPENQNTPNQKSFHDILNRQISTGLKEHQRDPISLFLSALTAGMEVGFSVLFMAVLYTLFHGEISASSLHVLLSASYSVGFIFVIIGRSELFTEHTVLSVLPVLGKKANVVSLLKIWGIIYLGNIIGGWIFSVIITSVSSKLHLVNEDAFGKLAKHLVHYDWSVILLSAILAGWLMGMLSWLVTSAQETISRLFIIFLVTFCIGLGGFHHCIVGSVEVFSGLLTSKEISLMEYFNFQSAATLGNIIGGCIFVAVLKFSHIMQDR